MQQRLAALDRDLTTARAEGETARGQAATLQQEKQQWQAAAAAKAAQSAQDLAVADGRIQALQNEIAELAKASQAVRQDIGAASDGENRAEEKVQGLISEQRSAAEVLADLKSRLSKVEHPSGG